MWIKNINISECNSKFAVKHFQAQIAVIFVGILPRQIQCKYCTDDTLYKYVMLLINVVKYFD